MSKKIDDEKITEIVGNAEGSEDIAPKKPTKKRTSSTPTKATKAMKDSTAEQLAVIFNSISRFLNSETEYTADDFKNESEIIEELKIKYDILRVIFDFISPIILLLQLYSKFELIRRTPKQYHQQTPLMNNQDMEIPLNEQT